MDDEIWAEIEEVLVQVDWRQLQEKVQQLLDPRKEESASFIEGRVIRKAAPYIQVCVDGLGYEFTRLFLSRVTSTAVLATVKFLELLPKEGKEE